MIAMPVIDRAKCDGCGLCVNVCRCGTLAMAGKTVFVQATEPCGWCTDCEAVCATGALSCPYEIVMETQPA